MCSDYARKTGDRIDLGHTCWVGFHAMGGSNKEIFKYEPSGFYSKDGNIRN